MMSAMKNLQTEMEEAPRCSDYWGCIGCPAVEVCEAFAETEECGDD
jgi:hypothetical protein